LRFALCKKQLHELTPKNLAWRTCANGTKTPVCRMCVRDRVRRRYHQLRHGTEPPLTLGRAATNSAVKMAWWQSEAGQAFRPKARELMKQVGQSAYTQQQSWCRKKLHRLVEENIYVAPNGDRVCKWCRNARYRDWSQKRQQRQTLDALRAQMLALHPDRHGATPEAHEIFMAVKQQYEGMRTQCA